MKKILTLTLSLLMAFSFCLTVSADDNSSTVEATIGEKEYTSFVEAFNDLQDGDTLKLEKNVTVQLNDTSSGGTDGTGVDRSLWSEVPNVTLDLNKFTLTTISNYGGAYNVLNVFADGWTVKNGSMIVKRANGKADSYALAVEKENAKLTIDNVSLSGGVAAYDTVVVTMKDTNIGATEVAATNYYCGYAEGGAKFIINGGTYNSNGTSVVFYADTNSSIEIFGGNFIGSIFYGKENGSLSVSGGTFSSDVTKYLTSDVNIAKVGDVYKVTKNGEPLPVTDNTAAVEETVYETLSGKKVKDSNGEDVEIKDSTEIILNSVDVTDATKKEEAIEKAKTVISSKTETNYLPLNITLTAKTGEEEKEITDLGEGNDITVTIYLNDATLKLLSGKDIKVVRIHTENEEEKVDTLKAELNANALTFKTNKFSTYVVAYSEKATPTKSYSSKDKNQDGVISCEEEMDSANWIWSTTKNACVYKVSNTGVR